MPATTPFAAPAVSLPAVMRMAAADVARRVPAVLRAIVNRRRAARDFAGFDSRMLADVGLTRADLDSAFAEPWWRDPTRRLTVLAVERRAAERARIRAALRERHARACPGRAAG